jgi:hypothetical protein
LNALIAGGIGLLLGAFSIIGGVSAYEGDPKGVSQGQLYTYADF